MTRFDELMNGCSDDAIFQMFGTSVSAAEFEAAWTDFNQTHILPSRLYGLATTAVVLTKEDAQHLRECDSCRAAFEQYKSDRAASMPVLVDDNPGANGDAIGREVSPLRLPEPCNFGSDIGRHYDKDKSRSVPEFLREHIHVKGPVVFPSEDVATESWQFGQILRFAKENRELGQRLTNTVAEHAKAVLLPRLGKENVILVCFGRAMHHCGTRLASLIDESGFGKIHVILAHDFYSPSFICERDEFRNSDVFVLVDVVHTGSLLDRLLLACLDFRPSRVRGFALIDQSGGARLSAEWFAVWNEDLEPRIPIAQFLRETDPAGTGDLKRFEPNEECGVAMPSVYVAQNSDRVSKYDPRSIDVEFLGHIHRAGALKSDFPIGQKRYPYVVNVLDLLKNEDARNSSCNAHHKSCSTYSNERLASFTMRRRSEPVQ